MVGPRYPNISAGAEERKRGEMRTAEKVIKTKVGLLELGKQLGNVSKACRVMGYSRDSFSRTGDCAKKVNCDRIKADAKAAGAREQRSCLTVNV